MMHGAVVLVTSTKVVFLLQILCLSVGQQDISKTTKEISMKCGGKLGHAPRNKWFNFWRGECDHAAICKTTFSFFFANNSRIKICLNFLGLGWIYRHLRFSSGNFCTKYVSTITSISFSLHQMWYVTHLSDPECCERKCYFFEFLYVMLCSCNWLNNKSYLT